MAALIHAAKNRGDILSPHTLPFTWLTEHVSLYARFVIFQQLRRSGACMRCNGSCIPQKGDVEGGDDFFKKRLVEVRDGIPVLK